MKNKFFFVVSFIILSVGFYFLGLYTHCSTSMPLPINQNIPDFTSSTPYLDFVYRTEACAETNTADDYVCIYKLSHSKLTEADTLANRLLQTTQERSGVQMMGYYEALHTRAQAAQKARDEYFTGLCELAEMTIYGGSGADLEREACMYYYTLQYIDLLKKLERNVMRYSGDYDGYYSHQCPYAPIEDVFPSPQ